MMVPVEGHNELPDYFVSHGWDFSLEEDGDLEYVENAIAAWTEWRAFLLARETTEQTEELDFNA